jgi:hypothetical protein
MYIPWIFIPKYVHPLLHQKNVKAENNNNFNCTFVLAYESRENLKLRVASGPAIFELLLRRRVVILHRAATCRPLFKP